MSRPKLIKRLDEIGVMDQLLRDYIDRGLDTSFIIPEISIAIENRKRQIRQLRLILKTLREG